MPTHDEPVVHASDLVDLFDRLTVACVDLFGAYSAALMLVDPHRQLELVHSSSEQMRELGLLELTAGAGPCLDAFAARVQIAVDLQDAEALERWPFFTAEARRAGFSGVQALPMRTRFGTIGGLNIFHQTAVRWSEHDTAVAQTLADLTAIAIAQRRDLTDSEQLAGQLQTALNDRVAIEQAKGVLAERGQLTVDVAFTVLRDYCRSARLPLTMTARELVTGRRDPDEVLSVRWPRSPR